MNELKAMVRSRLVQSRQPHARGEQRYQQYRPLRRLSRGAAFSDGTGGLFTSGQTDSPGLAMLNAGIQRSPRIGARGRRMGVAAVDAWYGLQARSMAWPGPATWAPAAAA